MAEKINQIQLPNIGETPGEIFDIQDPAMIITEADIDEICGEATSEVAY